MGFGLSLAKGAASTAANALTGGLAGGLVDGIFGLFGGNKLIKASKNKIGNTVILFKSLITFFNIINLLQFV